LSDEFPAHMVLRLPEARQENPGPAGRCLVAVGLRSDADGS
jgi:hypothetical protein